MSDMPHQPTTDPHQPTTDPDQLATDPHQRATGLHQRANEPCRLSSALTGDAHSRPRRWRRWLRPVVAHRPGRRGSRVLPESGQALIVVLGVIGLLSAGTVALAQNTVVHQSMISQDLLEHEAYQAVQAGINEYLSAANTNPDFVICDAANEHSGFCNNQLAFDSWTPVPGVSPTDGPPAWYWLQSPTVDTTTGTVTLTVVGSSGYRNDYSFQTGTAAFSAQNDFLLNVLWIDYNQIDPAVLAQVDGGSPPSCELWQSDNGNLEPGCSPVEFVSGDTLDGNLWVKDAIFVCGSPDFEGAVHTMDTMAADGQPLAQSPPTFTVTAPGCGLSSNANDPTIGDVAASTAGSATRDEGIPATNANLATVAAKDGCLFEGPTEITLSGTTMSVTSPDTPTDSASGTSANDGLDQNQNPNQCLPTAANPDPAVPANGVIFVEDCPNAAACGTTDYNPMAGLDETGNTGPTEGDAIVQGTVSGPLTIATANNIIVDGNLCYSDSPTCGSAPSAGAQDMLGLIAQNYVEINHPVTCPSGGGYGGYGGYGGGFGWYGGGGGSDSCSPSQEQDLPTCGTSGAQPAPNCDLYNPVVSAVSLAMAHSFLVNAFTEGAPLGTLSVFGTVDEQWRGPVGTVNSSGSLVDGYLKSYIYDQRLKYLSPPYYLSPSTPSWALGNVTFAQTLTCPLAGCTNP